MILKYRVGSCKEGTAERIAKKLSTFQMVEAFAEGKELTIEIDVEVGKQSIFDLGTLVAVMDRNEQA